MKKLLLFLIAVFALTAAAHAAYGDVFVDGNYGYLVISEDDCSVMLTRTLSPLTGNVELPSTATYNNRTYFVKEIGNSSMSNSKQLVSVIIPYGVQAIWRYAFFCCENLESVTIPNSVSEIDISVFSGCDKLSTITIPSSVVSIGECAFASCDNLVRIDVDPDNPNYCSVDGALFSKDKATLLQVPAGLTSYTIPNTVTEIGDEAFCGCKINSITVPNTVSQIESYAFIGCQELTSVSLPNTITKISAGSFNSCTKLDGVEKLNYG